MEESGMIVGREDEGKPHRSIPQLYSRHFGVQCYEQ